MILGDWQLDTVSGGRFKLDGGAMFGVVPKPLWSKQQPSDALNRIALETNCVLARTETRTVLIDTGFGVKGTPREQEQMELEAGDCLVAHLARHGVAPESVDTVVFSHLHFDHAGGGTRPGAEGRLVPTFPNATYFVNRQEWRDALSGVAELRGAYPLENLLPLQEAGVVREIEGEAEIAPGLNALPTGGHTQGHQSLVFRSGGETAIYLGDLCPTHSHLRQLWCMGYDTHLLETRRRKPTVLGQAADEGWLLLWDHDPDMAAARISRHEKQEFVVVERFTTL